MTFGSNGSPFDTEIALAAEAMRRLCPGQRHAEKGNL
jgi:hypothetical protein